MKYKVGDRIRVKKKYGYRDDIMETLIRTNYVLTINRIVESGSYYEMIEENLATWHEMYIEDLYDPIENRFEILDL
jgi:hypothetical protein